MANNNLTLVFTVKLLSGAPAKTIKIEYPERPLLYDIWVLSFGRNQIINCLVENAVIIPGSDTVLVGAQEVRNTPRNDTLELWLGGAK